MSNIPIEYDVVVAGEGYKTRIDWGNEPGWLERYAEQLENAHRLSLVPKEGKQLPVINIDVSGPDRRWILFSRVFGAATGGRMIRLYAIGWQSTIRGVNVKVLQWVYPGGALIELAEEPTHWPLFLRMQEAGAVS